MKEKFFWLKAGSIFVLALMLGFAQIGCSSSGEPTEASEDVEELDQDLDAESSDSGEDDEFAESDDEFEDEGEFEDGGEEFAENDDEFEDEGEFEDDFAEEGDEFAENDEEFEDEGEFEDDFGEEGDEFADSEDQFEDELEDELEKSQEVATEESGFEDDGFEELAIGDPPPPMEDEGFEVEPAQDIATGDEELIVGDGEVDAPMESDVVEVASKGWIPVKKIKTVPFQRNDRILNTVYLGRPGDTVESISQKIFGIDRTAELLADNPHLKNGIKTGDKLYYSSPNRVGDSEQMLTYYDDVGIPSQVYTTQAGDNIRVVSNQLLGNVDSWKEVWATNPSVESKAVVQAGLELKYWPEGSEVAPPMPSNELAQSSSPVPPAAGSFGGPPAPLPPANMPPPLPPASATQASVEPPPPPPLPTERVEPQEPPKKKRLRKKRRSRDSSGMDDMMPLAVAVAGGLLVGGAVLMLVSKKNRVKRASLEPTRI